VGKAEGDGRRRALGEQRALGPRRIRTHTFASLRRHRNYRLYFSGQLVSQLGTWLQNAAQAWLILDLTHSAQAVGVLGFCLYGPYAALGLIGGALADRFDRRWMLVVTQSAMALLAASLALVVYLRIDSVLVVDVIATLRGTVLVFNNPSRQALIVQLVGRRELQNAIALNSSLNNATRIIGPGIAGVLIASVGVTLCFALNAISFVAVIIALLMMRPAEFRAANIRSRVPLVVSIREGLRYARRTKTIAIALTMLFVISALAINFNVLLPVLARQTLHGGPQTYGLIASVFGMGAFTGAMIAASRRRASRTLLLIAAGVFGLAQVGVALTTSIPVVAAALFVTGVFYTIYTSSTNAIVQLATPGFLQGRVGGLFNYVFVGSGPFGSLLAGWLCERGGTSLAFWVGALAAIGMTLVGVAMRPWPMPVGTTGSRRRLRIGGSSLAAARRRDA
jgi:MFS family permease